MDTEQKPLVCKCGNDEFKVVMFQHEKEMEFGVFDVIGFRCPKCDTLVYVEYYHDDKR